ncbi:MAG: DNA starvation/stationary phase protection protein [Thermoproteota archaeon]|nr:DNA starvation/stationary phase protection protein [Thermoproteota archaeon]
MTSKSSSAASTAIMEQDIKTDIGVKDDARRKIVETLNMRLSDEYVLYTKTRKYHWNVIGPRFHQLHEFFKEQYEILDEMIDEIAERARQLGGKSLGTLDEFARNSSINEEPGQNPDAQTMISNLLKDHEMVIKTLRKNADEAEELEDMVTNDFFLEAAQKHEKMAWMLRAHLEGKDTI